MLRISFILLGTLFHHEAALKKGFLKSFYLLCFQVGSSNLKTIVNPTYDIHFNYEVKSMPIQKTNTVNDGHCNVCLFNNITNLPVPVEVACKSNL